MSLTIDPVLLLVPTAAFLVLAMGVVAAWSSVNTWRRPKLSEEAPVERPRLPRVTKRCRYCIWGVAHLTEETVRLEGGDRVDVKCFVCRSCGLPHWSVERTSLVETAH